MSHRGLFNAWMNWSNPTDEYPPLLDQRIEKEEEPLTGPHPHGCDDGDERNDSERSENDSPHEKEYHSGSR